MINHMIEYYVRKAHNEAQAMYKRLVALGHRADQEGVDADGYYDEAGKLQILISDRLGKALREINKEMKDEKDTV